MARCEAVIGSNGIVKEIVARRVDVGDVAERGIV